MVDAEMDGRLELEFFRHGEVGDAELFRSERVDSKDSEIRKNRW